MTDIEVEQLSTKTLLAELQDRGFEIYGDLLFGNLKDEEELEDFLKKMRKDLKGLNNLFCIISSYFRNKLSLTQVLDLEEMLKYYIKDENLEEKNI